MYQKHRFFIRYLIALLLFGFNGIVASHIALDSGQIVLLRTLLGSISLLAFFFLSGHRFSFAGRGMDVTLILLSGAAMGASWMFLYAEYQTIGVSTASLLYYSGPVIVMALSPLVFHEALTWVKVTGFLCVCGGIVLVNGLGGGQINAAGFIYGIMSAVCYAVMLILNKKAKGVDGMENSLLQMLSATAVVFLLLLCKGGLAMSITAASWPWILLLGIVNTGFGCWCYFSAIGALPVQSVAVCGYLEPLSAVIFSTLLLHERLTTAQMMCPFKTDSKQKKNRVTCHAVLFLFICRTIGRWRPAARFFRSPSRRRTGSAAPCHPVSASGGSGPDSARSHSFSACPAYWPPLPWDTRWI